MRLPWPFKKNKNDKEELDPFTKKKVVVQESSSNKRSFPRIRLKNPFKKKYRFGFMLRIKRFIAFLMWIVNIVTFFSSISQSASIVFLLTSFILFDYLWKTRRRKIKIFNSE